MQQIITETQMFRTEDKKRGNKTIRVLIFGGEAFCRYEVTKSGFRPHGRAKEEKDERSCQMIALDGVMRKHLARAERTASVMAIAAVTEAKDRRSYGYLEETITHVTPNDCSG